MEKRPKKPVDYEVIRDEILDAQRVILKRAPVDEPRRFTDARPHLLKAQDWLLQRFWGDPNIAGVALGPRIKNRRVLRKPVLAVSVIRKLPKTDLPKDSLLPERISLGRGVEIEVDVDQHGPYYDNMYNLKYRAAPGGVSASHWAAGGSGTYGCLVRDVQEGGVCLLSCNHVFTIGGTLNNAKRGEPILQPGIGDGGLPITSQIATFRRLIPLGGFITNFADAAIAVVGNENDVTNEIMGPELVAPTVAQPAVGMVQGGGPATTVACKWSHLYNLLGVEPLNGFYAWHPVGPGEHVQKTGRSSEYTASYVVRDNGMYNQNGLTFYDLIETPRMAGPGDSGATLIRGGPGSPGLLPPATVPGPGGGSVGGGCGTLGATQALFALPLGHDQPALEEARDKYLRTTRTGTYAVDVFYQNEHYIRSRIEQTRLEEDTKDLAHAFYGRYHGDAKLALADPDRDDLRVTEEHFHDAAVALNAARPHLADDEYRAAQQLLELAKVGLGKNARECLEILDDPSFYARCRAILSTVTTIDTVVEDGGGTTPGEYLPRGEPTG